MAEQKRSATIDLSQVGGPVFLGRDRGQRAREKFELDKKDALDEVVFVRVPDDTYSLNSSFFLGLFGESIKKLGSREAFLDKYRFSASEEIMATIESCIARALHEKRLLLGDND